MVGGLSKKKKEITMKCFHCQGELNRGKTSFSVNRRGYHIIVDDVPAWICTQCGEPLFDERQVNAIQQIIRRMDAEIPLLTQVAA